MSNTNCFCHLNDFAVKDAQARADIEKANRKIDENSANLRQQMSDLGDEVHEALNGVTEDIGDVSDQVDSLIGIVADSQEAMETMEQDINTMKEDIENLENQGGSGACAENYGAVGDGVTDDSDAIQMCINENGCVKLNGNYLVSKEIKVANNQKMIGENATLIASPDFIGSCVVRVTDNGGSNGSISNININGGKHRIKAVIVDHCRHFTIENIHSKGCYGGGIYVMEGYECLIRGFNLVYDNGVDITSQAPLDVCGIKILTSDCEVNQGACVNYPIGCYLYAQCRAVSVHCWGMPNISEYRGGYMLFGFVCIEKQNTLMGCVADTPTMANIDGEPGATNGGIGFFDANTEFQANAYPYSTNYIGCSVIVHSASPANSVICYHLGDANTDSSADTTIIPAIFSGSANIVKELVHFHNEKIIPQCTVMGHTWKSTERTTLGWQKSVYTDEQVIPYNTYAGLQSVEKTCVNKKIFTRVYKNQPITIATGNWVHINDIFLATANQNYDSATPGHISFTHNTGSTYTTGMDDHFNHHIGDVCFWEGTYEIYLQRDGQNFNLIVNSYDEADDWQNPLSLCIDVTYGMFYDSIYYQ